MNTSKTDTSPLPPRRTHIFAALLAVVVLGVALWVVPSCNQMLAGRQIEGIQIGVKSDLMLIHAKEKEFFEKHGIYTTDLKALDLAPKNVLYKFGFVKPSTATTTASGLVLNPELKDLDAVKKAHPEFIIGYSPVTKLDQIEFDRLTSYCPECTATETGFKAIAAGNLDSDPALDVWTIDDQGEIVHVVNDLD